MVEVPSAQDRVTANATPAEAIAWTNADSLVARERERRRETSERENTVEARILLRLFEKQMPICDDWC